MKTVMMFGLVLVSSIAQASVTPRVLGQVANSATGEQLRVLEVALSRTTPAEQYENPMVRLQYLSAERPCQEQDGCMDQQTTIRDVKNLGEPASLADMKAAYFQTRRRLVVGATPGFANSGSEVPLFGVSFERGSSSQVKIEVSEVQKKVLVSGGAVLKKNAQHLKAAQFNELLQEASKAGMSVAPNDNYLIVD